MLTFFRSKMAVILGMLFFQPGIGGALITVYSQWWLASRFAPISWRTFLLCFLIVSMSCLNKPCQNGATCAASDRDPTTFVCNCAPGYSGRHCQSEDSSHNYTVCLAPIASNFGQIQNQTSSIERRAAVYWKSEVNQLVDGYVGVN